MSERRSELRQRTLLGGRLAAHHLKTLDCLVRDLSPHGARLKCTTTGLGDDVSLEIPSIDGFRKDARIVWRDSRTAACSFWRASRCGAPARSRRRWWTRDIEPIAPLDVTEREESVFVPLASRRG